MYAVIKTGGKQYRVVSGEKLKIEQIPADVGAELTLDHVLMVGEGETVKVGTPLVAGATVKATVLSQGRHDKVRIFKMRRRKHYQKHQGHRQNFTEIRIDGISATRRFLSITVPMLKPVILFTTVTSTIGTLQLFDEPMNITQGLISDVTLTLSLYIFKLSFRYVPNFGYAATVSYVIVVLVAILAFIQFYLARERD